MGRKRRKNTFSDFAEDFNKAAQRQLSTQAEEMRVSTHGHDFGPNLHCADNADDGFREVDCDGTTLSLSRDIEYVRCQHDSCATTSHDTEPGEWALYNKEHIVGDEATFKLQHTATSSSFQEVWGNINANDGTRVDLKLSDSGNETSLSGYIYTTCPSDSSEGLLLEANTRVSSPEVDVSIVTNSDGYHSLVSRDGNGQCQVVDFEPMLVQDSSCNNHSFYKHTRTNDACQTSERDTNYYWWALYICSGLVLIGLGIFLVKTCHRRWNARHHEASNATQDLEQATSAEVVALKPIDSSVEVTADSTVPAMLDQANASAIQGESTKKNQQESLLKRRN